MEMHPPTLHLSPGGEVSTRTGEGQTPYLHLGGGLDELRDGDLVLLEPPLDQLGAADVDGAEDVPGVVLHEGAAVDDQGALRPVPQEAGQLLRIHHFAWEPVPGHTGPVPSAASGGKGREGREGLAPVSPRGSSDGVRCERGSSRPRLFTLLVPRVPTHCAEPGGRGKGENGGQVAAKPGAHLGLSPRGGPQEGTRVQAHFPGIILGLIALGGAFLQEFV